MILNFFRIKKELIGVKKIYASVDIGTYSCKFVVGEYFDGKLHVLASHSVNSRGIRKGLIVEPDLVVDTILLGINEINSLLGIEIKKVIVNVPDYNVKFKRVVGDVFVDDGKVGINDINKVIKDSIYNKLDDNFELVTMLPISYKIDGANIVDRPLGKGTKKLGIEGIMVSTPKKNIYSVLNVLDKTGLEVVDIVVNGISTYYEIRDKHLENKVGAVINFGHETTTVSIIEDDIIVNNETLQIGGVNVEKDISYVFGVSREDGRVIKEKFASAHKRYCQLNEIFEVNNNSGELIKLNQLEVSEVVMSRMKEILMLAKKQIRMLSSNEVDYIVLAGGLTEIKSFKNLAYEIFGKDVIIYNVTTLGCRDNKYVNSLGMIKYFDYKMESRGKEVSMLSVEEETALITPNNKLKKDNLIMNKIFGNFMASKEDKWWIIW